MNNRNKTNRSGGDDNLVRINKFFTDCGILSRRAAEEEIEKGRVKVNGKVAELGQKIDPKRDVVEYKGERIRPRRNEKYTYVHSSPRPDPAADHLSGGSGFGRGESADP